MENDTDIRPPNWPFKRGQRFGQDRTSLEPWDRLEWTLSEEDVYQTWLGMRRVFGGRPKYEDHISWRVETYQRNALKVLVDHGWVEQHGSGRTDTIGGAMTTYSALHPDDVGKEPEPIDWPWQVKVLLALLGVLAGLVMLVVVVDFLLI